MPRNSRIPIPGVTEVPIPRATNRKTPAPKSIKEIGRVVPVPAPRTLDLHMTGDKTGVRVKVGCTFPVTIYPRDYRRIGSMLGMDYDKAINERNELDSALVNRTQERDQARADHGEADVVLQDTLKELEKAKEDFTAAIRARDYHCEMEKVAREESAELRAELAEAKREIEKTDAHYEEVLEERHREIESYRTNSRRVIEERDSANKKVAALNEQINRMAIDLGTTERNMEAQADQIGRLTQAPGLLGRLGRWLWRKAGEGLVAASPVAGEEAGS